MGPFNTHMRHVGLFDQHTGVGPFQKEFTLTLSTGLLPLLGPGTSHNRAAIQNAMQDLTCGTVTTTESPVYSAWYTVQNDVQSVDHPGNEFYEPGPNPHDFP